PPHDAGIAAAIDQVDAANKLTMPALEGARIRNEIVDLGDDVRAAYLAEAAALAGAPDLDRRGLTVAYTPLHGVGGQCVEELMVAAGFDAIHTEPSQREPDGDFPTVAFPNPEEPGAMDRVLALATEVGADLVLANDPDADRLAVALPDGDAAGGYRMLSGDQVGALLADYLLSQPADGPRLVATTIVSSQLLRYLAEAAGVAYRETLTGFKWIANAAMAWSADPANAGGRFVMGYEEALGYTVGELVRDKDGVSAAMIFAELAAWNRARGRTVAAHLDDIYRRVGLFLTEQVSITAPGSAGLQRIRDTMTRFRTAAPATIAGHAVTEAIDLEHGAGDLPAADVLIWRLAGGRRVIMRPSGTEPKLKSYYEVRVEVGAGEDLAAARARARAELDALRDAHQAMVAADA
ncbi:MAG: phospho-sugar mutase, partial [Myxococcales bacterium]|nr:phospho-sugar mutase [Myxococcales bacterium]